MWKRIELSSAVLSGPSRFEGADGIRVEHRNIGRRIFLVDAVETDGGRITMHDSFNYADAIIAAEELARAEGIPVHDLVVGGSA